MASVPERTRARDVADRRLPPGATGAMEGGSIVDVKGADAQVVEWVTGFNALTLLGAGHASGLLDALVEPASVAEAAERLDADPGWTAILCQALDSYGIVERREGRYRLADGFRALGTADRPSTLGDRLGFSSVIRTAIEAGPPADAGFSEVSAEESLALARGVWGRATSPAAIESWRALDAALPEARTLWESGAEHAEFGCGVGRDLLRILVMYPSVRAVGYELLDHIAEETRRNARELGVSDRLEIETRDVSALADENRFDTILWSQMFFRPPGRTPVIEAIRRALRPGGVLLMPIMPDLPDPDATPRERSTQLLLVAALAYRRWDIHWVPEAEIVAELEGAGFRFLRTVPHVRGTPFLAMLLPP
jgi:SAM-dependent methyltransferase